MIRSLRSLTLMLALPLFVMLMTEQLLAMTCIEVPVPSAGSAGVQSGADGGHASHEAGIPASGQRGKSPSSGKECPIMATAAGCAIAALAVSTEAADLAISYASARAPADRAGPLSLLFVTSLFRPPQR